MNGWGEMWNMFNVHIIWTYKYLVQLNPSSKYSCRHKPNKFPSISKFGLAPQTKSTLTEDLFSFWFFSIPTFWWGWDGILHINCIMWMNWRKIKAALFLSCVLGYFIVQSAALIIDYQTWLDTRQKNQRLAEK